MILSICSNGASAEEAGGGLVTETLSLLLELADLFKPQF